MEGRGVRGREGGRGEVVEKVKKMLEQHGQKDKEKEIGRQLRVALETYTGPTSEERKIIMAQGDGLKGYLELCKHHELRSDASRSKLRGEIMNMGPPCKTRKEVKETMINLEAKRTKLKEMAKSEEDELQDGWMKTLLIGMLDKETRLHIGEEIERGMQ